MNRSVFVTGGSGFIGRHVVRGLSKQGYRVRVLSRRPPKGMDASVEVVPGDLTRTESFAPALQGVSAVVHAALTDGLSADVEVTSRLHELSAAAGVRQFVHLSTISVYGNPAEGTITEETPPIPTRDAYSRTKLAIEQALRATPGCPEIAILRLGCVYGPGGGWWTQGLLNMMAHGKLILVNGGAGCANLIHAEDVSAAVLLVAGRSNPPFELYTLTDGQPVAWSRYFSEIEKMLGRPATVSMSAAEAREHARKWLRPSLLRRAVRRITAGEVVYPLGDSAIDGYASRAVYSNAKASRLLGFNPAFDFVRGIESVRAERDSQTQQTPESVLA